MTFTSYMYLGPQEFPINTVFLFDVRPRNDYNYILVYIWNVVVLLIHYFFGHESGIVIYHNHHAAKIHAQLLEVGGLSWVNITLYEY